VRFSTTPKWRVVGAGVVHVLRGEPHGRFAAGESLSL
jgi:hypothetical protein